MRRIEGLVILSAAKDLLARPDPRKMILRCAQDDKWFVSRDKDGPVIVARGMTHCSEVAQC